MIKKLLFYGLLLLGINRALGQHDISLRARLDDSLKTLTIEQELVYHNTSTDSLQEIVLQDWANAYSSKATPLARRFSEDYVRRFHFAQEEEWGHTSMRFIRNGLGHSLIWDRPDGAPDLLRIHLEQPLAPGEQVSVFLDYSIKIPHQKFTRYGYTDRGSYKLRYWFLTPGVYRDGWQTYSHKDLNDIFNPRMDLDLSLEIPSHLGVVSALDLQEMTQAQGLKTIHLSGQDRLDTRIFLINANLFDDLDTPYLSILTNLDDEGLNPSLKSYYADRTAKFLDRRLGEYPHQHLLVTEEDYEANPVYGLNQLPKFIRPFPDGFNYDLKLFKTTAENYLENSLQLNPRKEKWLLDALQIYLLMEYVQEYYPEMKSVGSLSEVFGLRWFHAADLSFNDKYPLLYLHMARQNLDQALSTPRDSLVKFNNRIANPYKAGVGLKYLEAFLDEQTLDGALRDFYQQYRLQDISAADFERVLKENSYKDINWFFEDYVGSKLDIDYKFRNVIEEGDSLEVTIRNKTGLNVPIPLYGLKDGKVVYRQWVEDIEKTKTIKIPADGIDRLALNYEATVPEFNQRDNYWGINTFLDKPVQVRLLKDVEDPRYAQFFIIPDFSYNLYDGLALGPRIHNSTVLKKNFEFQLAPLYGFNSQTLIGSGMLFHDIPFENEGLHSLSYGISGSRFSYGYGKFYERLSPFLNLSFRTSDLRDSKRQLLRVRNVNVYRDEDYLGELVAPDYSIFNVNYSYSDKGMVDYFTTNADFQLSKQFSKFSVTAEYRKLFRNNRQINLRFFGGTFLYNDFTDSDYFSFALDRPTDYLYDYDYYGRSETSGFFSQQIIMAEGGFKSKLEPQYANQWLTSVNASTNLWKWIFVYGDVGLAKNKGQNAQFLYDSGIRLSLVQDYLEVFFPVYSNLGWEISQEHYDQRIRFILTFDLPSLARIFSREWY